MITPTSPRALTGKSTPALGSVILVGVGLLVSVGAKVGIILQLLVLHSADSSIQARRTHLPL